MVSESETWAKMVGGIISHSILSHKSPQCKERLMKRDRSREFTIPSFRFDRPTTRGVNCNVIGREGAF